MSDQPVTAGLFSKWKSELHPRGLGGRFIEINSIVEWLSPDGHKKRGKVSSVGHGSALVQTKDGRRYEVPTYRLRTIKSPKASIVESSSSPYVKTPTDLAEPDLFESVNQPGGWWESGKATLAPHAPTKKKWGNPAPPKSKFDPDPAAPTFPGGVADPAALTMPDGGRMEHRWQYGGTDVAVDSMSPEQWDAVRTYTTNLTESANLNKAIRGGRPIEPATTLLDEAIKDTRVDKPMTVYRGLTGPVPEPGEPLVREGFMSTTTDPSVARYFAESDNATGVPTVLEFEVPAGARALPGGNKTSEMILPRDTSLIVDSVSNIGGINYVKARYETPEDKRKRISEEQAKTRAAIMEHFLGKLQPSDYRQFDLVLGGAGSGKSTLVEDGHLDTLPENYAYLDADIAKELMPEYQRLLKEGNKGAASAVHGPSTTITADARNQAFDIGGNVVLSSVGSSYESLTRRAKDARKRGYEVNAHIATIDPDTAVARAKERAKKTGRDVPESFIRTSSRDTVRNSLRALNDGLYDYVDFFDNSGTGPVRFAYASANPDGGSDLVVTDFDMWEQFVARGKELKPVQASVINTATDPLLVSPYEPSAYDPEVMADIMTEIIDGFPPDESLYKRLPGYELVRSRLQAEIEAGATDIPTVLD